jgi:hypothetical protein
VAMASTAKWETRVAMAPNLSPGFFSTCLASAAFATPFALPFRAPTKSYCSVQMSNLDSDTCPLDRCVTRIRSLDEYHTRIRPSGQSETTVHVNGHGRLRSSNRLVILAVTADRSLASGLMRETAQRTCARHRHESTFLELPVDAFPEASAIARQLGVSRLPTIISFRNGARTDHIDGREARRDDSFSEFIQRNL